MLSFSLYISLLPLYFFSLFPITFLYLISLTLCFLLSSFLFSSLSFLFFSINFSSLFFSLFFLSFYLSIIFATHPDVAFSYSAYIDRVRLKTPIKNFFNNNDWVLLNLCHLILTKLLLLVKQLSEA